MEEEMDGVEDGDAYALIIVGLLRGVVGRTGVPGTLLGEEAWFSCARRRKAIAVSSRMRYAPRCRLEASIT